MSEGASFWESHWSKAAPIGTGRPSAALLRFVEGRTPGRSLDLGCGRGDDVVWLARRGWAALGVDVSETVLGYARANAERSGVEDRARFERHDLSRTFPDATFDLVTSFFMHSPAGLPRYEALARGAGAVGRGGLLLVASHGSAAPWSWKPEARFPTAAEDLAALDLDPDAWEPVFVGATEREARGPGGQQATVLDTVLALSRR